MGGAGGAGGPGKGGKPGAGGKAGDNVAPAGSPGPSEAVQQIR